MKLSTNKIKLQNTRISAIAAALLIACLLLSEHASACSDILANGTFMNLTARGKQQKELVELSRIERDASRSTEMEGQYGYISGKYRGNKREALKRADFRSSFEANESLLAVSSGDPVIVNAWLSCMQQNERSGPRIWFEVPGSSTNIRLRMQYVSASGEREPKSKTVLTQDVRLPAWLTVISGEHCLRKDAEIHTGGCTVELRTNDAATDLSLTVYTEQTESLSAYLPARLKAVPDTRPLKASYRISARPRERKTEIHSLPLDDGWFVNPEKTEIASYRTYDAKGGGIECHLVKDGETGQLFDVQPRFVGMRVQADNDSKGDSGSCEFVFSYEVFRYVLKPI